MSDRIVLPEEVIARVKQKCDAAWDESWPPIKKLQMELTEVIRKNRSELEKITGLVYDKKEFPSDKAVRDALRRIQKEKENIGAGKLLRNLMCYYGFEKKNWHGALEEMGLDEKEVIKESEIIKSFSTAINLKTADIQEFERGKKENFIKFVEEKAFICKERFGEIDCEKSPFLIHKMEFGRSAKKQLLGTNILDANKGEKLTFENGKKSETIIYKCDDYGNLLEKTAYRTDGKIKSKEIFKYDRYRNITKKVIYNPVREYIPFWSEVHRYENQFDDLQRLIRQNESIYPCPPGPALLWFDKIALFLVKIFFNKIIWKENRMHEYFYDEKGRIIRQVESRAVSKNILREKTFAYDSYGNKIEEVISSEYGIEEFKKWKYGEYNKLIESRQFNKDRSTLVIEFDNHENPAEIIRYKDDKVVDSDLIKHDYDKFDNWIKKYIYIAGSLMYFSVRNIEYYTNQPSKEL